jgi:hypothetical protein
LFAAVLQLLIHHHYFSILAFSSVQSSICSILLAIQTIAIEIRIQTLDTRRTSVESADFACALAFAFSIAHPADLRTVTGTK